MVIATSPKVGIGPGNIYNYLHISPGVCIDRRMYALRGNSFNAPKLDVGKSSRG
jgi:hypothetical protein